MGVPLGDYLNFGSHKAVLGGEIVMEDVWNYEVGCKLLPFIQLQPSFLNTISWDNFFCKAQSFQDIFLNLNERWRSLSASTQLKNDRTC